MLVQALVSTNEAMLRREKQTNYRVDIFVVVA